MSNHLVDSETRLAKVMESQQFDRIVSAILAGKYSWACVLILRFAGYNPLQYIPYRTYNRLMKNNSLQDSLSRKERDFSAKSNKPSYQINNLSYLETASPEEKQLHGGNRVDLSDWDLPGDNFDFLLEQLRAA